jgi:hypothetical protein
MVAASTSYDLVPWQRRGIAAAVWRPSGTPDKILRRSFIQNDPRCFR